MTDLDLYSRLSTRSKRALTKTRGRWGHEYDYRPRGDLLVRLAQETGMSIEQVYNQLLKERMMLIGTQNQSD